MIVKLLLTLSALVLQEGLEWHDASTLGLEGKGWPETALPYDRLPADAEGVVRDQVWQLSRQSAGLVLRFTTDSREIRARWKLADSSLALPHMAASAKSGLDLYGRFDGEWRWLAATKPTSAEQTATLFRNLPPGARDYLLYLPLYNQTLSLDIGLQKGALVKPTERPDLPRFGQLNRALPIVFYGTSITQGASASRPGMTHSAILGRRLDHSVINLGFSGNGRMEIELAEFLAEIPARLYSIDCLPNMNPKMVEERAAPFVRRLRELRPNTPILLVEDRINTNAYAIPSRAAHHADNHRALRKAFATLLNEGMEQLHYLHGSKLLGDDFEATVDGSHPTDLGFVRMANAFEPVLREALIPMMPDATPNPEQLRKASSFFRAPLQGLNYATYLDNWQTLDQMKELRPSSTGSVNAPSLRPLTKEGMAAIAFTGWVQVPSSGIYTFTTVSVDGSRWYVGEDLVVENDGLHGPKSRSGHIALEAGWHPIRIEYFNASGEKSLELRWAGPDFVEQAIPSVAWAR